MANTILLPYTAITNPHTPKRRHWRRYTTTMTINTNQKLHSSSPHFVHNSTSNLPDIVNDCHNRCDEITHVNQEIKLTCKEIAHSLRLVADQVDRKYCQVSVKYFFHLSLIISFFFFLFRMLISIEIYIIYPFVLYFIRLIFAQHSILYGHDHSYHSFY